MTIWRTENARFQMQLASQGGEICSLWDKQLVREWIWQPRKGVWNNSATQLFPVVGRLIHDGLWLRERFFPLPAHGFLRQQPFERVDNTDTGWILESGATEDTLNIWPWKWRITLSCELTDDGLVFRQQVMNEDNEPFWFSLGWHPGFALPVSTEPGWKIHFSRHCVSGPFPTCNRTLDIPETAGRTDIFPLMAESFKDGAVYFGDAQGCLVSVLSPDGKVVLEMETGEQEWLALWGIPGADLLCIEPLAGTTDAPGFDGQMNRKRGMQQLEPGQSQTFTVRLRFPLDA